MADGSFSLFENAFWVLKARYESNHAEIVDLAEDAEFEESHPQELIQRSQQSLVSPIARLDQELGWLPGLSERQIDEIRALLDSGQTDELLNSINFLPDLPKANLLAHLSNLSKVDNSKLQALLRCWDEVEQGELLEIINSNRNISGFPNVDATQMNTSITALGTAHAKSVAKAIWQLEEPGKVMEHLVEAELATGKPNSILGRFVREYDSLSEPKLAQIRSEIDHQIALALEPSPNLDSVTKEIAALLSRWDDVNQPVQVYEQHQGHEEGRSKKIYESVRSLCLELANDRSEFQYARRLSEALLHTFPELESVAEVLKEDVAALENLDEQQQKFAIVEPLVDACEAVKAELPQLKSALKSRFSNVRRGSSKSLYETFSAAVDVLDTKDAAYLVVRELALFVNNERNDPETAFRLLDWLLNLQSSGLSQDLRSKLVDERSVLHKNWKMKEFEANKGNASAMNRIIDEMLEFANPQDRRDLENLKTTIRENRNQRIAEGIGGWVVWIVVVLIFGFVSSLF